VIADAGGVVGYMSPCNIEKTIKAACGLIGAMMTVGDARSYDTALIVLDA
jgi:long-subunit acyl-CoA synthetase (AMP-forming)